MSQPTFAERPVASPKTAFVALLLRDVRVARRELRWFLVRTLMQPILFLVVFGYLLPKMGFVRGDYTTALLPGILGVSMAISSLQSVALPMVQDFGYTREIEDRLLAPIPTALLAIEKVVAGAIQGVLAALVVLPIARIIMGPIDGLEFAAIGWISLATLLGATTFASFGLLVGTLIQPQQMGLLFSIIVAPMMMFGCAYYPWQGLASAPAFQIGVLIDPLVYVSEAMRGALTPDAPHMPMWASLSAMLVLIAVFLHFGIRSFVRRAFG